MTRSYKINEVYDTIQGEGAQKGRSIILVRFAKCNLTCSYCDTEFNSYTVQTLEEILERCRQLGNVVVVGLNSDASVRSQDKSGNRPIIPQEQRAEVLAGLHSVDYVTIFDEPTPKEIVEKLTPDVLVKGEDWAKRGVVGREHVEAHGGRVVLVPLVEGVSTTSIAERICGESSP